MTTILSNPTPRLFALRALIIASIGCIVGRLTIRHDNSPDPEPNAFWISLLLWCLIIVHHLSSVFKFDFQALNTGLDWILVSSEISGWFALRYYLIIVDRWASEGRVLLVAALYVQLLSLVVLWLFRTTIIYKSQGLRERFNFFSQCEAPEQYDSCLKIIFGKSLCESRITGEPILIVLLRGFFAICSAALLLAFCVYAIVIGPVRETGFVPAKAFRTANPKYDFPMSLPIWSIVAFMDMEIPAASQVDIFKAAVNVTAIWDGSDPYKPQCQHLPGNQTHGGDLSGVQTDPFVQTITILCPNRLGNNLSAGELMKSRSSLTTPDLLITVNFTALGIKSDTLIDTRLSAVSIVVGLTSDLADVVDNTLPTPLIAGAHLFGGVSREFRRQYDKPRLAALGVFSSSKTFLIGNIAPLITDPSPLIPRLANTATLRLYGPNDFSDWLITEDHRDKSVWGGFAAVGGFFTFVNGAFALLFGTNLLLCLFGIRPLSVLGILDCVWTDHQTIWIGELARIWEELDGSLPHLALFLRNHLVNFDSLNGAAHNVVIGANDGTPPPMAQFEANSNGSNEIILADSPPAGTHMESIPLILQSDLLMNQRFSRGDIFL